MKNIVVFLSCLVFAFPLLDAQSVYTKRKGNDVREGPGSYYGLILTLPENTKLTLLEKTSTWVKVQLPSNKVDRKSTRLNSSHRMITN
jgi:uncharacterized protein YgiM (DUF1202 family)